MTEPLPITQYMTETRPDQPPPGKPHACPRCSQVIGYERGGLLYATFADVVFRHLVNLTACPYCHDDLGGVGFIWRKASAKPITSRTHGGRK